MTSYHIRLEGDTLKVDFAKNGNGEPVPSDGDQIVRDVTARLQEMKTSGELQGGNLLKIDGRISILASYTLSHEVAHLYRAIAVSDTRLGAYVVTLSTAPEYPVGSRIDFQTGEVKQVAAISEDCISQSPVSIGKVHRLVRGQDISSRPMVQVLADLIVNLALENSAIVAKTS